MKVTLAVRERKVIIVIVKILKAYKYLTHNLKCIIIPIITAYWLQGYMYSRAVILVPLMTTFSSPLKWPCSGSSHSSSAPSGGAPEQGILKLNRDIIILIFPLILLII